MQRKKIIRFRKEYIFLSNFYPCEVEYDGLVYPSVENAYQAAKTEPTYRKRFLNLKPIEAKRYSMKVPWLLDWQKIKIDVMQYLVFQKFTKNPDLKDKLISTGDAILIEGTTWGDEFWGVNLYVPDKNSPWGYRGRNLLGQILMEIREYLKQEL